MSPKLFTLPVLAIALGMGMVACQTPEVRSPYGENDEVETEQPRNYPENTELNSDDDESVDPENNENGEQENDD
jgi:hypothetical protein